MTPEDLGWRPFV